jgi:hypothetical protein
MVMVFIRGIARATGLGHEHTFYLLRTPAWRGGGGLLSRHHLLSDAVVSDRVPRAHRRLFHGSP